MPLALARPFQNSPHRHCNDGEAWASPHPVSLREPDLSRQAGEANPKTIGILPVFGPGAPVSQPPARAASFSTVFQLRPVPLVPSFFSITAMVSFERPMPSG